MMKQGRRSPLGLYSIGIAALFLAGFFLLVVFGAQNYRKTVAGQSSNMRNRALLSYLSTVVKSYDQEAAVEAQDSEYGRMLIVHDGDSGYDLRIYLKDESLMEDYALSGSPLNPEEANVVGETKTFTIDRLDGKLLRVTTDEGYVLLHLRSEGNEMS